RAPAEALGDLRLRLLIPVQRHQRSPEHEPNLDRAAVGRELAPTQLYRFLVPPAPDQRFGALRGAIAHRGHQGEQGRGQARADGSMENAVASRTRPGSAPPNMVGLRSPPVPNSQGELDQTSSASASAARSMMNRKRAWVSLPMSSPSRRSVSAS